MLETDYAMKTSLDDQERLLALGSGLLKHGVHTGIFGHGHIGQHALMAGVDAVQTAALYLLHHNAAVQCHAHDVAGSAGQIAAGDQQLLDVALSLDESLLCISQTNARKFFELLDKFDADSLCFASYLFCSFFLFRFVTVFLRNVIISSSSFMRFSARFLSNCEISK